MTARATGQDGVTVWGGVSSELIIVPTLYGAVSVPAGAAAPNLLVRGGLQYVGYTALGADLLFSAGPRGVYGGPSAAVIFGENSGWLAGGVLGYRNTFGGSRLGFFVEGKARYLFLNDAVTPNYPPGSPAQDFRFVSPGVGFGLTYRF